MDLNQRIFRARTKAGLSQSQLAERVGKTRGAVAQWEAGTVRPRHETMKQIAAATGASLTWLESGIDTDKGGLTLVGEVAAGVWKEGSVHFEPISLPIALHPDYPPSAQRAYRVIGTSTNRVVGDGEYVHTVEIHGANLQPTDGDFVVVRRIEHDKAEYTAKRLVRKDGVWWLRPESTDPQYQNDIPVEGDESSQIEITDLVIARWAPIARGRGV